MILTDGQIKELAGVAPPDGQGTSKSETNQVISDFATQGLNAISYDLRIKDILISGDDGAQHSATKHTLDPGDTVFISTIETISLPDNYIAIVIPRNSCIRMGLSIDAPIYHPGHHTRIFVRVSNVSDKSVILESDKSVCSLMFSQLSQSADKPYRGAYKDEFDFTGVAKFHDSGIPRFEKFIENKMDAIRDIEKSLYGNVIVIMTVFIGIFSLINLNSSFLNQSIGLNKMLLYNLISIGGISALVSLVSILLPHKPRSKVANCLLAIVPVTLLLVSCIIVLCSPS